VRALVRKHAVTGRAGERIVLVPLLLAILALVVAGETGRLGAGFSRYVGFCGVGLGMVSGRLLTTFLPPREPEARPKGAIGEWTQVAILLLAVLAALLLVRAFDAALH